MFQYYGPASLLQAEGYSLSSPVEEPLQLSLVGDGALDDTRETDLERDDVCCVT